MTERVAITFDDTGGRFGEWSEVEIARGLDSYTAVSLMGPFDHQRPEVRAAFQPLMFPRVALRVADELVFTGRVKDVQPSVDASVSSIGVTAYSIANDITELCVAPELLPLEFNGLDLRQIAYKMVGPAIGEDSIFDGNHPGFPFKRVRCEPDRKIHDFILELALQRGFVLADAPNGALLFRVETVAGAPVARLTGQPLPKVTARFEPGNWFGRVTGRASKKPGRGGSKFSMYNSCYRAFQPRDTCIQVSDTEAADVPAAVRAAIGRMVASVVSYTVEDLPTWRDPSGQLWAPNTTVTLLAPGAMIYRETEFLVRAVTLRQTPEAETATLQLVLPGTFGGRLLPKELPWDL